MDIRQIDFWFLLTAEDDDEDIIMEAKRHTFPFAFRLREGLPTSFEASHGHIRYWLHVAVDIPKAMSKKRRKPITVLNRVDLNNFEDIRVRFLSVSRQ